MSEPIISADTAKMLGIPDATGGNPVINMGLPAVKPGDTLDLTTGTAPAFVPDRPLGQVVPSAPPPAAGVPAPAPFELPAPQTVETHDQHTQYQSGKKIDAGLLHEQNDAQDAQIEARKQQARLEMEQAKKVQRIEQEQTQKLAAIEQQRKAQAEAQAAAMAAQLDKVKKAQTELESIQDPKESIGTKIGQGIALALGGLGKALGGTSTVEQVIENDRAQRMNAWKAQYTRTQGKVAGQQNIYAQLRQKGLDDEQATAASIQYLNSGYSQQVRSVAATYKAPMVQAAAAAEIGRLQEGDAQAQQALQMNAQGTTTTVRDDKSVTKAGGSDVKDKKDLIKLASEDEYVKDYRAATKGLGRFKDMVAAGADGAAIADFIAGKGGLDQGSFGPSFQAVLKKRSWLGEKAETIRSAVMGGNDPALLKEITNALAVDQQRALSKAKPSITQYQREFRNAGIDPRMVTGGETADEAAAAVGATAR